jgi:molybdate transport system permease protein
MDWTPLILSFKLAICTSFLLLLIVIPLARMLAFSKSSWRPLIEAVLSLPLILPPTVLGFYFLLLLSPGSALGSFLDRYLNVSLVFSFWGLVIASIIYSLPFMLHPVLSGLRALPNELRESAALLGKSKSEVMRRVLLPAIRPAVTSGFVMSFAHTIGEFGIVLMIGGNIPGKTRVASIAIFDHVEALQYDQAANYSLILIVLCLIILAALFYWNRNQSSRTVSL